MSIARIQLRKVANRILSDILKIGIFPDPAAIISGINNAFKGRLPGFPLMIPKRIVFLEKTNPEKIEGIFKEVKEDLETLYEEAVDQTTKLLVNFNWAYAERIKLEREINNLKAHLKTLIFLSDNADGYFSGVFDSFADVTKVQMDYLRDIEKRNLVSAEIDLNGKLARLKERTGKVYKYDIHESSVHSNLISVSDIVSDVQTGFETMLDDNVNTSWIRTIVAKVPASLNITLVIDVKSGTRAVKTSQLSIALQSPKPISVEGFLEDIEGKRFSLEKRFFNLSNTWFFSPIDVVKINLSLVKTEPDEVETVKNSTDHYGKFIFGINNLSLSISEFESSGELISIAYDIPKLTRDPENAVFVRLDAIEEKPPNTDIEYWIGRSDKENPLIEEILWKRIGNFSDIRDDIPKVARIGNIRNKSVPVDGGDGGKYNLSASSSFVPVYTIYAFLDNEVLAQMTAQNMAAKLIPSSVSVYTGRNQFQVSFYEYSWRFNDPKHIAGINEFNSLPGGVLPETVKSCYKNNESNLTDTEETLTFRIPKSELSLNYKYTTFVFVPESEGRTINVNSENIQKQFETDNPDTESIESASLWINGIRQWAVKAGNLAQSINFIRFKQGWNSLEVVINVDKKLKKEQILIFYFVNNGIPKINDLIMSSVRESSTIIPFFDLAFNRRSEDRSICGIDKDKIFVNFNPNSNNDFWDNTKFLINYSYLFDNEAPKRIFFRAHLKRNAFLPTEFVTPMLKEYRLVFSHNALFKYSNTNVTIEPEPERESDEFVIFHTTEQDWEGI